MTWSRGWGWAGCADCGADAAPGRGVGSGCGGSVADQDAYRVAAAQRGVAHGTSVRGVVGADPEDDPGWRGSASGDGAVRGRHRGLVGRLLVAADAGQQARDRGRVEAVHVGARDCRGGVGVGGRRLAGVVVAIAEAGTVLGVEPVVDRRWYSVPV